MTGINFAQLLEEYKGAGDPPPDGIYDTVCTKAEAKTASTGKPMIVASFRVITGPEANKTITNNFVLSQENPNAFWFFVRHMAVFGIDQAMLGQITDLNQLAPHLVNKQARLTIQKQAGRNLPNVTGVEPVPGGMLSAAPQTNGGPAPQVVPDALAQQYPQAAPAAPAPALAPAVDYAQPGIAPTPQPTPVVLQPGEQVFAPPQPPQAPAPVPPAPAPQPPQPQPAAQEQVGVPQPPQVPF